MNHSAHSGVVQRFFSFVNRHELNKSDLAVAFSGGPDSTALAICAAAAVTAGRLTRAIAIHIDHGVRPESGEDARRAALLAVEIGIPFRMHHLDLAANASEADMRDARYEALVQTAQAESIPNLATAHHQRDQAETVLLHLLRGSGTTGLGGIRSASRFATPAGNIRLFRPLLRESPQDITKLVVNSGLKPIIDPTNKVIDKTRNFLRHEVMPRLSEVNPGVEGHLGNLAEIIQSEYEFLDSIATSDSRAVLDGPVLDCRELASLAVAVQRRVIRLWVTEQTDCELTFDRCEAVRYAAMEGSGSIEIELSGGWSAHQRDRRFTLRHTNSADEEQHD